MGIKADVLFSSRSDEYETPAEIYEGLDAEFGFTLDPCATAENAKCMTYFTKEDDGLSKSWGGHRVFCNPPYSQIKEWVRKSYWESLKPGTIVVLLIPARTDTKYFHDYIYHRSEIRFLRGRIRFNGLKDKAPFPSMAVIFRAACMK